VIIFSMLISSGLGSFFSRRFIAGPSYPRLKWVLFAVAGIIVLLAFAVAPITETGVGLPLALKMLIAIGLIVPAGFLMGIPFPTGLTRLEERFPHAVRWAWSLNSAASVMGSALAILLAIYIGLRATLLVGGALYLAAVLVVWLQTRTKVEPRAAVSDSNLKPAMS
jgi:predicted MFS family arabinose efflux permease